MRYTNVYLTELNVQFIIFENFRNFVTRVYTPTSHTDTTDGRFTMA